MGMWRMAQTLKSFLVWGSTPFAYSWVTEKGSYLASNRKFTPAEGAEIPEGYVDRINSIVTNKVKFSRMVQNAPFFTELQKQLDKLS